MDNPYVVLGIPDDATPAQIKSRYRRLAKRWHPDMPKGNAVRFQVIQEAYDLLAALNFDPPSLALAVREAEAKDNGGLWWRGEVGAHWQGWQR